MEENVRKLFDRKGTIYSYKIQFELLSYVVEICADLKKIHDPHLGTTFYRYR